MSSHRPIKNYIGVLILGVNSLYRDFCFFKLFPMGCKGLNTKSLQRGTTGALTSVEGADTRYVYTCLYIYILYSLDLLKESLLVVYQLFQCCGHQVNGTEL